MGDARRRPEHIHAKIDHGQLKRQRDHGFIFDDQDQRIHAALLLKEREPDVSQPLSLKLPNGGMRTSPFPFVSTTEFALLA
ncbi:hypothetical protein ACFB49_16030 [Sphingomonas sp. DBB INV C78]